MSTPNSATMATMAVSRRTACLAASLGCAAAGCGDLFHTTEWSPACGSDCGAAGGGATGGAGGTGARGGAGGTDGGTGIHDGKTPASPGLSCRQIVDDGFALGDAPYWIDPTGTGDAFQAFCLMSAGGFTLAAVIAATDGPTWSTRATWTDESSFGVSSSAAFTADMKNPAWSTLAVEEIRIDSEGGGVKTTDPIARTTLAQLFGTMDLLMLTGSEQAWAYPAADDQKYFGVIQNPPSVATINLAQRNRCVLTMGYDQYAIATGPDDEVHGFGCTPGDGGGSGACYQESCGDVIRDFNIRIWGR